MSNEFTIGEQLIEHLINLGVEYFIGTPGTEFAPIIEKFSTGVDLKIKPITAPHEYLAVNIAYGIYLSTGKPAAVMVHSTIGTLNAAAGIMNASRMNIPIIFIAGRSSNNDNGFAPKDLFIHWAQESFDQAGSIREYLKWDYEVRHIEEVGQVIKRGFDISLEEPKGPVYFVFPRNLLLAKTKFTQLNINSSKYDSTQLSEQVSSDLYQLITQSKKPIVITKRSGASKDGFEWLQKFVERFNLPVFCPNSHYLNIPHNHPNYFGEGALKYLEQSDLVLILDMDVPWIPSKVKFQEGCKFVHVAIDPLFQRIPNRHFESHFSIKIDLPRFFKEMIDFASLRNDNINKLWIDREQVQPQRHKEKTELTNNCVERALNTTLTGEIVIVNELALNASQINLVNYGSYFRTGSASGLGWAMGAAIGLSLGSPEKIIINVVGDGAYYFGNPCAYHWVIEKFNLPIITIVLNNSGMYSISKNVENYFHDANLSLKKDLAFLDLSPSLSFEKLANLYDGIGVKVHNQTELELHLAEAILRARNSKYQTVINAIIK